MGCPNKACLVRSAFPFGSSRPLDHFLRAKVQVRPFRNWLLPAQLCSAIAAVGPSWTTFCASLVVNQPSEFVRISVIIPTLNEESCLAETLQLLRLHNPHEIIVADGGSTDATCWIAKSEAVRLVRAPPGRAAQMNAGAAEASGDVFLFLHADCSLEVGAFESARRLLKRRGIVAGCFRMKVRAHGFFYRAIDFCASARVRLTGIAYGDQGLFLYRQTFTALGGFPPLRLMEDLYLSRTLRQRGRLVVADKAIYVSPRRWQQAGLVRQTLRNWLLTTAAATGVSPDRLARYYPAVRGQ